jgi:hypothetical protein
MNQVVLLDYKSDKGLALSIHPKKNCFMNFSYTETWKYGVGEYKYTYVHV